MSNLFSNLDNFFNANITNWDTSSVTTMEDMFYVRSARALLSQALVRPSLRAPLAPPPQPAPRHRIVCPPPTRQGVLGFSQPLSWDTSNVTDMGYMFYVRSARALPTVSVRGALFPVPCHCDSVTVTVNPLVQVLCCNCSVTAVLHGIHLTRNRTAGALSRTRMRATDGRAALERLDDKNPSPTKGYLHRDETANVKPARSHPACLGIGPHPAP